jgi:hypothetical protein
VVTHCVAPDQASRKGFAIDFVPAAERCKQLALSVLTRKRFFLLACVAASFSQDSMNTLFEALCH